MAESPKTAKHIGSKKPGGWFHSGKYTLINANIMLNIGYVFTHFTPFF